jgi:two-component system, sensor histidine kinase
VGVTVIKRWTSSLQAKIFFIATVVVLVAMLANALTSSYFFTRKHTESHLMWAEAIATVLGGQLERILFLGIPIEDLQGFERQCAEVVGRNADLAYAYVVSSRGDLLFHNAQHEGEFSGSVPSAVLEAIAKGRSTVDRLDDGSHAVIDTVFDSRGVKVAHVVVGFPSQVIEAARSRLLLLTLWVDLLVYGLSIVLLFLALSRFVIRPLRAIVHALEAIQPGEPGSSHRLPDTNSDELSVVVRAFNRLLERLRQHEAELLTAKDAAEKASRAKSDFLAVMSHEIRTPMHAVLGMSELLLKTPLNTRQGRFVSRIRRSGRALLSVINDILDFSRIDTDRVELETISFDASLVAADVVETLAASATEKGLSLKLQCPHGPVGVCGDPTRFMQVLMNLVSNAIKFTEQGSVTLSVQVHDEDAERVGLRCRTVVVEVSDTGIGIAPEVQAHIFQPFSQADSSITRRFGGSGLGLAIVARVVDLMQGSIELSSAPGTGSHFVVRIPFEPTLFLPPPVVVDTPSSALPFVGVQVLLVEDDPVNQEVAKAMLEDSGVTVVLAENGEQALEQVSQHAFDLVLMDCHMPVCDGFRATAEIRAAEPRGQHLPVVALTADVLADTRERCRNAGMDDYLGKPFSQEALMVVIRRWVRGSEAGQVAEADEEHRRTPQLFEPAALGRIAALKQAREKRLVERTLEIFLGGLPALLDALEGAARASSAQALFAAAHQLKSSSANVGAMRMSAAARELEEAARNGAPAERLAQLQTALNDLVQPTRMRLQQQLDSLNAGSASHE